LVLLPPVGGILDLFRSFTSIADVTAAPGVTLFDGDQKAASGKPPPKRFRFADRKWVPVLLALAALLADAITPRGVADGFFYTVAILGCLWVPSQRAALVTAAFVTPLFAIGHFISPPSDTAPDIAVLNRLLSLLVMWITAGLVTWRLRYARALERAT